MGSVVLPHLVTGWHVDQAIMSEEERLVIIRFGRDWDPDCMRQDEVLYRIADRVKNFAVIYVCDLDQVPDFKQMYELYDPVTLMFFFRNKHMMCDFGTGNNNKLNWVLDDKQELIDIIETIYRGAKKGRGLVIIQPDIVTRVYGRHDRYTDYTHYLEGREIGLAKNGRYGWLRGLGILSERTVTSEMTMGGTFGTDR
ncbi:Thioredoxin-like protein 4A [Lachnellula occidentalis]|uniref:Thioredoxin-like protein 4A n=1 Tax=Lachnellula occidentalis TaxID=215460 RepID=A0A8H8RL34_9HELO|nr:Thioredoxin-like protein 4A [Lachnellula occidentalis]